MSTVLTIDGVDYDNMDRPELGIHLDELTIDVEGGYDQVAFSEMGAVMIPMFTPNLPVSVTFDGDLVFTGTIGDVTTTFTEKGWQHSYTGLDRKHLADQVNVTGTDLTGSMSFNRSPEDPYYTASESGLDVGQIILAVLTVQETAVALDARGVGAYTSLSPPTLPVVTQDDLDLLTIVPPQQVTLSGEGVMNQIEQFLMHWHPNWRMKIQANGTIRFLNTIDITTFVPRDIKLAGGADPDPVYLPGFQTGTASCATRMVIRGMADVEAVLLSTADGTLEPAWSSGDETAWTLHDYTDPVDATSQGTTTSVTGSSVVVDPTDATVSWASNFWSGRQATIFLFNDVATGITMTESRQVTSNTACSAGGTCTVTWDSSLPLSSSGFNRYRLVGGAGSRNDVGRLYNVREPHGPDLALNTFVGSHLVRRSEIPIRWANNSRSIDVFYPTGIVRWNSTANPAIATTDMPVTVEVLPRTGQFRFTEPVVKVFGPASFLNTDYPTTAANGKPADVQVLALYSRGTLLAIVPPDVGGFPQYEGTAANVPWNLEVTKVLDLPTWMNRGDFSRIVELAQEHLDAIKNVVISGSFDWYGLPPWDFLTDQISVNFVCDGGPSTGLEAINAPVRQIKLQWPAEAGMQHRVTFTFSTQRRPFSGDDLHIPPAFSADNFFNRQDNPFGELADMPTLLNVYDRGANLAALNVPSMGQNVGLGEGAGMYGGGQGGIAGMPTAGDLNMMMPSGFNPTPSMSVMPTAQTMEGEGVGSFQPVSPQTPQFDPALLQQQQKAAQDQQQYGPSGVAPGSDPWQGGQIDARPTMDWDDIV